MFNLWSEGRTGALDLQAAQAPVHVCSVLTRETSEMPKHAMCVAGYPLVDACMRELGATGLASNHARLNAASFLACSMGFDWRLDFRPRSVRRVERGRQSRLEV